MTPADALRLGRVSNLPTVWSNVLAGLVLAGAPLLDARTAPLLLALSLMYVGGMYLNDAFDAAIDARERPERPIPAGRVRRSTVFTLGFGMLALALALLAWLGLGFDGGTGAWPALGGAALAATIVAYDAWHKTNPLSPVVMGLCRVLVYVTAGLCFVAPVPSLLLVAAGVLLCYLIGLTYVAKQENLGRVRNLWPLAFLAVPVIYGLTAGIERLPTALYWLAFTAWMLVALWFIRRRAPGDVPRAVVSLIAGISLFDALVIAAAGAPGLALLAVAAFALTLALQRLVAGT